MTDTEATELRAGARGRRRAARGQPGAVRVRRRHGAKRHARPRPAASRHPQFALVPVEVRFHVEERGFPGLLAGRVSRERLRGPPAGLLVEGLSDGAHAGDVPVRPRAALRGGDRRLRGGYDGDPEGLAAGSSAICSGSGSPTSTPAGLVEQSTDTVAAGRDAGAAVRGRKFIHVVRDGRDASASRVAQTRGVIAPAHPAPGPGVVGGADPARGRRVARDPTRPPADRQPRRAADARPAGPAAAVPFPGRLPPALDAELLPPSHERRARPQRALARGPLGAPGPRARGPVRGGARPTRGRRDRVRAAPAPDARALPRHRRWRPAARWPTWRATAASSRCGDELGPRLHRRHGAKRHPRPGRGSLAGTPASPRSRSRRGFTATPGACRTCSGAA